MRCLSLWFTAPFQVDVRHEELPAPAAGQALVQVLCSAISPGTEMLVYRGQFPRDMAVDESLSALSGAFAYPLRYGYSTAGRVIGLGPEVAPTWQGRLVFAFQPHTSHFVALAGDLIPVPDGLGPEEAVFLPNMETAVNFLLDGRPLIGERVVVFGQGVVGLLTTALLARLPLAALVTLDRFPSRREWSLKLGAGASLEAEAPDTPGRLRELLTTGGADLCYELSGSPAALDQAIASAGFAGRIIVGSWYGQKRHPVDLGGRFHRARLRLVSSQVSTLAPELQARWTKTRRLDVAWRLLAEVRPDRLITHRFPLADAARAYQLIDQNPAEAVQVVFQP